MTPGIVLERVPYDSPEVQALVGAAHGEVGALYLDDERHPPDPIEGPQFEPPWGVFVIATVDGAVAGCGGLRRLDDATGEVKRMFVARDFRRRGVATGVLDRLHAAARSAGYTVVRLETGDRQPEAIALYETAGYRRIPPYGIWSASRHSVCFEIELPPI